MVTLRVEPRTARSAIPGGAFGFDCYFLNITGSDIDGTAPFGVFSPMVSVTSGGKISATVPKGTARKIQVVGVQSTVGCLSAPALVDLNSFTKFTTMFLLAQQTQDLQADTTTIDLTNNYDASKAVNIRNNLPAGPLVSALTPATGCVGVAPTTVIATFSVAVGNYSTGVFQIGGTWSVLTQSTTHTFPQNFRFS